MSLVATRVTALWVMLAVTVTWPTARSASVSTMARVSLTAVESGPVNVPGSTPVCSLCAFYIIVTYIDEFE